MLNDYSLLSQISKSKGETHRKTFIGPGKNLSIIRIRRRIEDSIDHLTFIKGAETVGCLPKNHCPLHG